VPTPNLAYVAQGRLHLQDGAATPRVLESAFGRSLRERAAQIHNRNVWKTQGFGAQFMGLGQRMACEAEELLPIWLTSVTRGAAPGEVLYALETPEISGVFAIDENGFERRLFHTADFRVRSVAVHPDGSAIALSVAHSNMVANLAILNGDGSDLREVSEGDSFDMAPHWRPGPGRRLVFQSAGLGTDSAGRASGQGPFAIQQLDLDSSELQCLAEDPEFDHLGPQMTEDGTLYYIRRPYGSKPKSNTPLAALKATLLMPFHLGFGILSFLTLFSALYTRKRPDWMNGAQNQNTVDQIRVWGETIVVSRGKKEKRDDGDAPSLVPSTWQLIRQSGSAKDVLADGILSFDIAGDGAILYSNGRAVHRYDPNGGGKKRIFVGDKIEQVAAL